MKIMHLEMVPYRVSRDLHRLGQLQPIETSVTSLVSSITAHLLQVTQAKTLRDKLIAGASYKTSR